MRGGFGGRRQCATCDFMSDDAGLAQLFALGLADVEQRIEDLIGVLTESGRRPSISHGSLGELQRAPDQQEVAVGMFHDDLHLSLDDLRVA